MVGSTGTGTGVLTGIGVLTGTGINWVSNATGINWVSSQDSTKMCIRLNSLYFVKSIYCQAQFHQANAAAIELR